MISLLADEAFPHPNKGAELGDIITSLSQILPLKTGVNLSWLRLINQNLFGKSLLICLSSIYSLTINIAYISFMALMHIIVTISWLNICHNLNV